jgi:hypothetical protein
MKYETIQHLVTHTSTHLRFFWSNVIIVYEDIETFMKGGYVIRYGDVHQKYQNH